MAVQTTLPLFPPRVTTRACSREGAEKVRESAEAMRERILEYIVDSGDHGRTCDECEEALEMKHQTCSARINEMMKPWRDNPPRVWADGRKRPTRSGVNATVWRAP